jgi:hypothetical protein
MSLFVTENDLFTSIAKLKKQIPVVDSSIVYNAFLELHGIRV